MGRDGDVETDTSFYATVISKVVAGQMLYTLYVVRYFPSLLYLYAMYLSLSHALSVYRPLVSSLKLILYIRDSIIDNISTIMHACVYTF